MCETQALDQSTPKTSGKQKATKPRKNRIFPKPEDTKKPGELCAKEPLAGKWNRGRLVWTNGKPESSVNGINDH